jgi:diadenylate cyclase
MGALVVLGDGPDVLAICSGGFLLDAPYSPQRLSELAKMDGAIILAADGTRIARANVHLVPTRRCRPARPARVTALRARRALAAGAGGQRQRGDERHQRLRRRREAPGAGHHATARSREPGVADARAVQGAPRRLAQQPHALEVEDVVTVRDVAHVVQRGDMVRRSPPSWRR